MLYPKNQEKTLDPKLFENPTAEYRATPFWAWNCELREDLLRKEIGYMKEMGLGGFHMHCRVGMSTPYLSDEFMKLISDCVDEAKKQEMLAWLYDEDKWPSGFAGGLNTKEMENRQKWLFFTPVAYDTPIAVAGGRRPASEKHILLACYDVELNAEGYLLSYRKLAEGEEAIHKKWSAYLEYAASSSWYNGQSYCDTLQKSVIENFVKITHERYQEVVGDEFGKTCPAIFTDEPQVMKKQPLYATDGSCAAVIPFTTDFDETFEKAYGFHILDKLPEVFFELPNGGVSHARWCYHDHAAERFAAAFSDTIGEWCEKNNIKMTGHMMSEPSLNSQSTALGDCMRSYRGFTLPGIDMLADHHELSTAKQCQSAVRQYGREGMMSELYGVTNWYFDFTGHKQQGDWQAAMGVTVRVPHLFWVSMRGEAKRDYPASIGYQSPWYREYSFIEDHFARVNTVMTRGKPIVNIGVVHPVESYWLCLGPFTQTDDERTELQKRYYEILNWLLDGTLDYDLICESTLPAQFGGVEDGFRVGVMNYQAVVVPTLRTIRSTTLDALEAYVDRGGKVIFMGGVPKYVDALPSDRAQKLAARCHTIDWSRRDLFSLLEPEREITLRDGSGCLTNDIIYQLREDGDRRHLFVSHINEPKYWKYDTSPLRAFYFTFKGEWKLTLMDTLTGKCRPIAASYQNGNTLLRWECGACDSLLLEMEPGKRTEGCTLTFPEYKTIEHLAPCATFSLDEPNVLLLDMPRYAINDGEIQPAEEILRADDKIRKALGIRLRTGGMVQPWVTPIDKDPKDKVTLIYDIDSEIDYDGAELALESLGYASVTLNGIPADMTDRGYYVDEDAIRKIALPPIRKGQNTLVVEYRFSDATQLEAMYLLGDFGVECHGRVTKLVPLATKLGFDDTTAQTLPFYGGNITYHFTYTGGGQKTLAVQKFVGTAIRVDVDGKRVPGLLAFPPHRLDLGVLPEGEHQIDITLYGNRYNTMGALHSTDMTPAYCAPDQWRKKGRFFNYEYLLREHGILTTPQLLSGEE